MLITSSTRIVPPMTGKIGAGAGARSGHGSDAWHVEAQSVKLPSLTETLQTAERL